LQVVEVSTKGECLLDFVRSSTLVRKLLCQLLEPSNGRKSIR